MEYPIKKSNNCFNLFRTWRD